MRFGVGRAANKTDMAGSKQGPATTITSVNVVGQCSRLTPAATSPGHAASAASSEAATSAAAASAAATSAAAASATPGKFLAELGLYGVFLVEHIECRQADVGYLL